MKKIVLLMFLLIGSVFATDLFKPKQNVGFSGVDAIECAWNKFSFQDMTGIAIADILKSMRGTALNVREDSIEILCLKNDDNEEHFLMAKNGRAEVGWQGSLYANKI